MLSHISMETIVPNSSSYRTGKRYHDDAELPRHSNYAETRTALAFNLSCQCLIRKFQRSYNKPGSAVMGCARPHSLPWSTIFDLPATALACLVVVEQAAVAWGSDLEAEAWAAGSTSVVQHQKDRGSGLAEHLGDHSRRGELVECPALGGN
jgi:hypothetical protein